MRTRLAAMAAPRDSDSPRLAKLRAVLRDEALMAHVTANVEQWPPLSQEQRDTPSHIARPLGPTARQPFPTAGGLMTAHGHGALPRSGRPVVSGQDMSRSLRQQAGCLVPTRA